ncbi:hypothetical protein D3C80_2227970 [compost metagenome]
MGSNTDEITGEAAGEKSELLGPVKGCPFFRITAAVEELPRCTIDGYRELYRRLIV